MITSAKRDGNKLTLTIQLADKPTRSKSAVQKAIAKGLAESTVPETLLASTGGFALCEGVKVSMNIIKA